jgi:hypothetical protein
MTVKPEQSSSFFSKYIVEILFVAISLPIAAVLNLQFIEGSNINTVIAGHDEYIAVKEVYSILHPVSWKHFFLSLIAGDVIFYGRIMFYVDAIFAWIPFKIWGVEGMVYAIRMTHSVFLISGLLILANVFLKQGIHKALFLLGTGAIFYSLYFLMMPKPEPMQLFFLALFLYYFKKTNWAFGLHFVLLGIAFGLKFNVLLLLPVIFILPFIKNNVISIRKNVIKAIKSCGFFLLGLFIAIPCLLLSPLKPIYLQTYIHETFMGTGKSYDKQSLSIFDWLKDGFGGYYLGHWIMGYFFLIFCLIAIILQIRRIRYSKDLSSVVLLVFGFILTGVIMVTTKRLWPHYLWTGFIFLFLGLVMFSAQQTSLRQRRIYFSLIGVFSVVSFIFFITRDLPMFMQFDKDPVVAKDYQESKIAIAYIKHQYPLSQVATDPSLLYLFVDFVKAKPYHPFNTELAGPGQTRLLWYGDHPEQMWEDKNDLVVFYKNYPPKKINSFSVQSSDKDLFDLFKKETTTDFVKDTTLGNIMIYRRHIK